MLKRIKARESMSVKLKCGVLLPFGAREKTSSHAVAGVCSCDPMHIGYVFSVFSFLISKVVGANSNHGTILF